MAYKSLLLSFCLTTLLGYALTAGLTDPQSPLKKLPDWTGIPMIIVIFLLYLLAGWWGIKGFAGHKFPASVSLAFCALGLGLYALGFVMEIGHGKALPGQYDSNFSRLEPTEKSDLEQIVQGAGLTLADATFSEHWHVAEQAPGFRVCVQKGHITALHFSGKRIPDLRPFSRLPQLGDLYLRNCGLENMNGLRSEKLDRLDLADNQIQDIKTLAGCPNLRWLVLRNNQLASDEGLALFTKLVSQDLSGNPFPK